MMIFDLGSLQVSREQDRCVVRTASLVSLASVPLPCGTSAQEATFMGLDAVLASSLVAVAPGRLARVGLYNPFTAEVAAFPVPQTVSHADGCPLDLDPRGTPAVLSDGMLVVAGRSLPVLDPSASRVLAALGRL